MSYEVWGDGDENGGYVTDERADEMVAEATAEMREALQNCLLLASRHRKEEWAQHIIRFCADGGVVPNPMRATPIAPAVEPTTSEVPIGPKLGVATEQTEAQDDGPMGADFTGKLLDWTQDRNEEYRAEIESLRAQLEAARGERDAALKREGSTVMHRDVIDQHRCDLERIAQQQTGMITALRADLAQKMQEHQDALSEMRGRMEGAIPLEPTEAMVQAGYNAFSTRSYVIDILPDVWRAMYRAANPRPWNDAVIDAALSPPSAGAV